MTFLMLCVRVCLVGEGGGDEVRESGVRCGEHGEVAGGVRRGGNVRYGGLVLGEGGEREGEGGEEGEKMARGGREGRRWWEEVEKEEGRGMMGEVGRMVEREEVERMVGEGRVGREKGGWWEGVERERREHGRGGSERGGGMVEGGREGEERGWG